MVGLDWMFAMGLVRGGCGLLGRSGGLVCGFLGVVDTCRKTRHERFLIHVSAAKQTWHIHQSSGLTAECDDSGDVEVSVPSWWSVRLL